MFEVLDRLLMTLSMVPGLKFLEGVRVQLQGKQSDISQKIGDLQNQKAAAISGVKQIKDAPKNIKGSKKRA